MAKRLPNMSRLCRSIQTTATSSPNTPMPSPTSNSRSGRSSSCTRQCGSIRTIPDWYLWYLADAYDTLGQPEDVIATVQRMHDPSEGQRMLAANYAHLGMTPEAETAARAVLRLHPEFKISVWRERPVSRQGHPREVCRGASQSRPARLTASAARPSLRRFAEPSLRACAPRARPHNFVKRASFSFR